MIACLWYLLGFIGASALVASLLVIARVSCLFCRPAEYERKEKNWLEHTGYTRAPGMSIGVCRQLAKLFDACRFEVIDGSIAWQYTTALHWSLTQFTPAGKRLITDQCG